MDFVKSIVLHEQYSVLDECPQALPSYDSRRMGLGYLSYIVEKFKTGRSWNGKWSEDNMKVKNGTKFVIDLEEDCELSADTGYQDLLRFCQTVLNRLRIDGQFLPYFDELAEDHMLINECYGDPEKWPRFLLLISNPLALKPPLVRASFICNIYIAGDAHSSGKPPQYGPLYSRKNCVNWRLGAMNHQVLLKVYSYLHEQKILRYKYLNDHWSLTHWHIFKFSRHFIQHGLGYTKGEDLTQKIADISVLDILLSRNISTAIAKSVTFLVLHCGVDGIFSSPWRHFMGSDYIDKPEDAIAGGVVQELLHSIEQKSGYVYSEVSLYSEPQYVSIISNTDLIQLQEFLNGINFECVHKGDHLQYGPVKLKKRICAATKECPEHGVIVLEGPISAEYDCLYDVLLAADALRNLPPTL